MALMPTGALQCVGAGKPALRELIFFIWVGWAWGRQGKPGLGPHRGWLGCVCTQGHPQTGVSSSSGAPDTMQRSRAPGAVSSLHGPPTDLAGLRSPSGGRTARQAVTGPGSWFDGPSSTGYSPADQRRRPSQLPGTLCLRWMVGVLCGRRKYGRLPWVSSRCRCRHGGDMGEALTS